MPSITFTYKTDLAAGKLPAHVHYSPLNKDGIRNNSLHARPIAIVYHGGGFAGGSTEMIPQSQVDALTKVGFVVVLPEYRLCPQVSLEEGPLTDARDSFKWAKTALPAFFASEGILVNGDRVAAIGQSAGALLALSLGTLPDAPNAILDFYGTKYLSDPFWREPVADFASVPDIPVPDSFHTSPVAITSAPMFTEGGKPNATDPRVAYILSALKNGTLMTDAFADGDIAKLDPTTAFGPEFPPTYFLQGTEDGMCPVKFGERAVKELKAHGVVSELVLVPGPHGFDMKLKPGDELFDGVVMTALNWLADHV